MILIIPAIMLIFGAIGASMARSRKRDPLLWFAICSFMCLFGVALLAILGNASANGQLPSQNTRRREANATLPPPTSNDLTAPLRTNPERAPLSRKDAADPARAFSASQDAAREWAYLMSADPAVREAAGAISLFGPAAMDKLRDGHLALRDPIFLPHLVAGLRQRYGSPSQSAGVLTPPQQHRQPVREPPSTGLGREVKRNDPPHEITQRHQNVNAGSAATPIHTSVAPQDLVNAKFIETYRGIHLFQLSDGRYYVDGQLALPAYADARAFIDRATGGDTLGARLG